MGLVVIEADELRSMIREELQRNKEHDEDHTLTVEEVATILKLHPKSVYRIKDQIGFEKHGKSIRFSKGNIRAYRNKKTYNETD
jgi:hypothetical protein